MTGRKTYYPGVDLLRIVACFGIVGCHLNLPDMTEGAWFLKRFTDFNVCVFAVLSGFFLFRSRSPFGEFLRKRSGRLLVPYAVWTVVYVVASASFHYVRNGRLDASLLTVSRWLGIVFWGNSSCHLWFVICLFYASCALFLLRTLRMPRVVWLLLSLAAMAVCQIGENWYCCYPVRLLGCVMMGGWLATAPDGDREMTRAELAGLLAGLAVGVWLIAFADKWLYVREVAIALPLCALAIRSKGKWFAGRERVFARLGALSFTVYLVHPLVTAALQCAVVRLYPVQTAVVFGADWILAFLIALLFAVAVHVIGERSSS